MAGFLLPLAGALLGGIGGYLTSPDDNKLGGTITGGLLGGLTGGIGGMASKAMGFGAGAAAGAAEVGTAAATTGRIANSSWNPISLLKSAYTPDAMGAMNLGMDALPLIADISTGNVGPQSFSSVGGTMLGTKFGRRELNHVGSEKLESEVLQNARNYKGSAESFDANTKKFRADKTLEYTNSKEYSRPGFNMGVGMGADMGLYSLASSVNKPKELPEMIKAREQQEFRDSPVSKYMQMTGMVQ